MDFRRITRSAALSPIAALLVAALLLATNPDREQVMQSLLGHLHESVRWIPLATGSMIPTLFAKWLCGCALFAGWSWLPFRTSGRKLLYAAGTLATYAVLGMVLWTTTIQFWGATRRFSDALQGWFIVAFVFAYCLAVFGTVRGWMRDIGQRCPECLDRLCMPVQLGLEGDVLLGAGEVESICLRGHGALTQTRWSGSFRPVEGFWKELLK